MWSLAIATTHRYAHWAIWLTENFCFKASPRAGIFSSEQLNAVILSALTNARFAPLHRLEVGPLALPTPRIPLRKSVRSSRAALPSAAGAAGFRLRLGGGRCASAAIRQALLSASAPLSPLADHRPKPGAISFVPSGALQPDAPRPHARD